MLRLAIWSCFISGSATSVAQIPPDLGAQQLLRQQQKERAQSEQLEEQRPDVRLPRVAAPAVSTSYPADESPCFVVDRILLQGDHATEFFWALQSVDDARGLCLGSGGINTVIARVQDALIAAGYVTTRVLAPPQDMRSGQLLLTVVPGRIRSIHFAPPDPASAQWLGPHWGNAVPARPGDILNLRDIEQGLENFKRVSTAEADIQIVPGDEPGQSDLVILWKQATPVRFSVSVDDSGSESTGKYQGGVTLSLDNPLGLNDLFYLNLGHDLSGAGGSAAAHGTRSYATQYSLPYGYWLLALSANEYYYHQSVAGANQDYIYSGSSRNFEAKLSRLVYRNAVRKTTVSISAYRRASRNFIDDTEVVVQQRRMGGFELGLAHKEFIGPATLEAALNYKQGTGAFGTLPAPEEAFGEGTSRPKIVTANLSLNVPFSLGAAQFNYSGSLRAQWNRTPLIVQDRFSIGGRYTVRGFDGESSLSAERGWLSRNDLGWNIGESGQQLYLGLDYAELAGPSTALLPGTRLGGAVLGLRGQWQRLQYEFFAGKPLLKPASFHTASVATGFNLSAQF